MPPPNSIDAPPGPSTAPDTDVWPVVWCLDAWHDVFDVVKARLPPWAELRMLDPALPLAAQVGDARVLIPTTGPVPAAAIRAAPRLALITQPASGLDNVDVGAAVAAGVPVCNAPGVNAASVAEGALMSLLMVARRYPEQLEAFKAGKLGQPLGVELRGKALAVVGARGAVGSRVCAAAAALGMSVLPLTSDASRADVAAALAVADAVSLHCPLTERTRHLIDRPALATAKRGILVINYSRGAVVDEEARTWAGWWRETVGGGGERLWGMVAGPEWQPSWQAARLPTRPHPASPPGPAGRPQHRGRGRGGPGRLRVGASRSRLPAGLPSAGRAHAARRRGHGRRGGCVRGPAVPQHCGGEGGG